MSTVKLDQTYQGLTNQPSWRTQPGQVTDILNLRLDIAKGATTRNGTELIANLSMISPFLAAEDIYWTSFNDDIIGIHSTGIYVLTGSSGIFYVVSAPDGYSYLSGATKADLRSTVVRNSILILNRTKTVATQNSDDYTIAGTVDRYSDLVDLSPQPAIGTIYRVKFNDGAIASGYYKRADIMGDAHFGDAVIDWMRIAAPDQPNAVLDPSTMPHQLIKDATTGEYVFSQVDWAQRRSGNDENNPFAQFVNKEIKEICFHSSRLFLLSDGSIEASSSRDLTLFYLNDIDNVDESDYISHDIGNTSAGEILYSYSMGYDLFIACTNGQLAFSSGNERLTNINGTDLKISDHQTSTEVRATCTGSSLVLLDVYGELHEYAYDAANFSIVYLGTLNAHALRVLKGESAGPDSDDVVVDGLYRIGFSTFITTNGYTRIHEKTLDAGNLVQTGWTKFNFNSDDTIVNSIRYIDSYNGVVRMIVFNDTTSAYRLVHYTHKEENYPATFQYSPCLDNRQYLYGTYIQSTNRTRFSYSNATSNTKVATGGDQSLILTPVSVSSSYIEVDGRITALCCVGDTYEANMLLVNFYAGASTIRPTLSTIAVFYVKTATFNLDVYRKGSNEAHRSYVYKANRAGYDLITDASLVDGSKTFNIMGDGRNTEIFIYSTSPTPMTLSAFSFEVRYTDNRSTR